MVEGIRRAGSVAWALCGIVAVLVVLGIIAWVIRVIWPPAILAGAIVFLLNPIVTALQGRGCTAPWEQRSPTSASSGWWFSPGC